MPMCVIVVGGGPAGLGCARTLHRAGVDVEVIEASDGVGGRVRSDHVDGYTLDRGFQVLFTAYPAALRQLDYDALTLKRFDPGAVVCRAARREVISDPVRDPKAVMASLAARSIPFIDKLRAAVLAAELRSQSVDDVLGGPEETTEAYLRGRGFTDDFVQNFARPFFGSIFLADTLETSARAFRFDYKMLGEGATVVPAGGMGAISAQLAADLTAAGRVRLGAKVSALTVASDGEAVTGVRLQSGETLVGEHVVVATAAPEAERLTGVAMPPGAHGTTQLYFVGDAPLHAGRKILLHANRRAFVRSAVQLTNVALEYAPPGRCLFSASVIGVPEGDDATLAARAIADLQRIFAGDGRALATLNSYRLLRIYRIPYGQFAQPPGIYESLPGNDSGRPGLLFAGEFTTASSLNAAMRSGEKAAQAILSTL
jgi:phytoene dehydrogenase-like protein